MRVECKLKAYIQPFEVVLALQELEALAGSRPTRAPEANGDGVLWTVDTDVDPLKLAQAVTYWEQVDSRHATLTAQVRRELTQEIARKGSLQSVWRDDPPVLSHVPPRRRCLRYGPHGIHEYRGKFFPQLVRSLVNIGRVPANGIVADPMSGSGTTLAEVVLAGRKGVGLDLNPLSVLLSRTKCEVLESEPRVLVDTYRRACDALAGEEERSPCEELPYFGRLPEADRVYLRRWLPVESIGGLDTISRWIETLDTGAAQDLSWVSLSNIIRSVSWQKNADLRVRKEVAAVPRPIPLFLQELERNVKAIVALLRRVDPAEFGAASVQQGSATNLAKFWPDLLGQVDAVITSPPYATALPYLDTDRLSLSYLRLLPRPEQRKLDRDMIGNREITKGRHDQMWIRFEDEGRSLLPSSVCSVVDRIHDLNSTADVGFRRKNKAALLSNYFFDMREVLIGIQQILRPGASAFVVVGSNRTRAGGTNISIDTPQLLADIGDSVELESGEHIDMDMLKSRDIFKRNAIPSERIIVFTKRV